MVPKEYLHSDITTMPQPRNMNKKYLHKFISHLLLRQASMSPDKVFQFSHWRTRNGVLTPAQYPRRDDRDQLVRGTKPPGRQRAAKKTPVREKAMGQNSGRDSGGDAGQGAGQGMGQGTGQLAEQNGEHITRQAKEPGMEPATGRPKPRPKPRPTQRRTDATREDSLETQPIEPMQLISEAEMEELSLLGHPLLVPHTGPVSGPPQFMVSIETVRALRQQPTPQSSPQRDVDDRPQPVIDPALLEIQVGPHLTIVVPDTGPVGPAAKAPVGRQRVNVEPTRRSTRRR